MAEQTIILPVSYRIAFSTGVRWRIPDDVDIEISSFLTTGQPTRYIVQLTLNTQNREMTVYFRSAGETGLGLFNDNLSSLFETAGTVILSNNGGSYSFRLADAFTSYDPYRFRTELSYMQELISAFPGALTLTLSVPDPPTITSISPTYGTTAGGTSVTITGSDFQDGATVDFDNSASTSVVFVSSSSLTAVTPASSSGTASVKVTNPTTRVLRSLIALLTLLQALV